jgi:tetratricopeptide (TPR) repeat protein
VERDRPSPSTGATDATVADVGEKRAVLRRGATVGRYIVVGRVGGGGMGVIYAAYDPELDRKVAIKLLRADDKAGPMEQAKIRLLREAQAMARLSHPNVIAVHDVGTFGDEVFIAMELVEGGTARDWLAEAPRTVPQILRLFTHAGHGVAAAHHAGLIHRDIKPENILVGRDGRVRVLDFGLARAASDSTAMEPAMDQFVDDTGSSARRALETPLTQVGAFLGTPGYMSPEQLKGGAVDARSDQFSFCVALYRALYDERPFEGATVEELLYAVGEGRVRPPTKKRRVPSWTRKVLLRGLDADPSRRFPSMDALLAALERDPAVASWRWLLSVSLVVMLIAGVAGFRRARREHGRLCQGAELKMAGVWDESRRSAMQAAFTATGLPYSAAAFASTSRALDRYAEAWTRMHTQSCEATRLHGEQSEELLDLRTQCLNQRLEELHAVTDLLVNADAPLVKRSLTAASGLGAIDECADAAALRLRVRRPTDPAARASLERLEKGVAQVNAATQAGRYTEAEKLATPLLPSVRSLKYRPLEANLLSLIGTIQSHSDLSAAIGTEFQALLAAEAGRDDLAAIKSWSRLMFLNGQADRFEEARRCASMTQALLERAGHPPVIEAGFLLNYGDLLDDEGKPDEAIAALRRSIELKEKLGDPLLAMAWNDLSVVLVNQGRPEEGLKAAQRALELWEPMLGAAHPNVGMALLNMGEALLAMGKPDEARKSVERALALDRAAAGPDSRDVRIDLQTLADAQLAQKHYADALRSAEQVLAIRSSSNPIRPLYIVGAAQHALGRTREAAATFRKALDAYSTDGKRETQFSFRLAQALWETGDRVRGRALALEVRAAGATRLVASRLRAMDEWLADHP